MSGLKSYLLGLASGLPLLLAAPVAGATEGAAPLQRVELSVPMPSEDMDRALAALHGRPLDAAVLSEAETLLRDFYGWLEWQDLDVALSTPAEEPGLLRIRVQGQPPAPATAPPAAAVAVSEPAAPVATGGAPATTLPADYAAWLRSPARVLVVAADRRLYLKHRGKVLEYTVAVGTERTPTPPGEYRVQAISHKPTWYPTRSIRKEHAARGIALPAVVPPGRGNPLGDWFVRLRDSIGIHGTDQPDSIGQASSYGCIRMRDRDIAEVVRLLRRGDRVVVINHDAQRALSLRE